MATAQPAQSHLSAGFAGVALADILANGVAIIVIMIVVSLMIRYEQEQEKLEQAEDVSVLLSREIASSLVMNALPTSPPAVLHNYTTSPLDRNPMHTIMPILELHDQFVRDYYTHRVYPREELLKQDNRLDSYILSLTPDQLIRLRIDVYSIRQFYIAMSILKQHGHRPRHWHFLGPGSASGSVKSGSLQDNPLLNNQNKTDGTDDVEGWGSLGQPSLQKPASGESLPEDVSLATAANGDASMEGILNGQSGVTPQDYLGLPSTESNRGQTGQGAQGRWSWIHNLPRSDARRRATKTFRTAVDPTGQIATLDDQSWAIDNLALLRAYFDFMTSVQEMADEGLPAGLAGFDFKRHIVDRVLLLPETIAPELVKLFQDLEYWFGSPMLYDDYSIPVIPKTDAGVTGQVIRLPVNQPLEKVQWLRNPDQPALNALPEKMQVGLQLNVHPEIYRRVRVPIDQDAIFLMPPVKTIPDLVYRWRVLTSVSPEVNDFVTGFVYAAVDAEGQLLLPVSENAIDIGGAPIKVHVEKVVFISELWQLVLYSLVIFLFIAGFIFQKKTVK